MKNLKGVLAPAVGKKFLGWEATTDIILLRFADNVIVVLGSQAHYEDGEKYVYFEALDPEELDHYQKFELGLIDGPAYNAILNEKAERARVDTERADRRRYEELKKKFEPAEEKPRA